MALTRELNELACRLGNCAELARSDVVRDLERSVYGCDYGATVAQRAWKQSESPSCSSSAWGRSCLTWVPGRDGPGCISRSTQAATL
jgi:hypothetical protein